MMCSFVIAAASAAVGLGVSAPQRALERFWSESSGKTIRRLPVQVQPCNAFTCLGNSDFTKEGRLGDVYGAYIDRSVYNCITLTLRCTNDLSDAVTYESVGALAGRSAAAGIQTLMDVDARIARDEFMRSYPDEAQGYVMMATGEARDGKADFTLKPDAFGGHMAAAARRDYEPFRSRLLAAWACRLTPDRMADGASFRRIDGDVRLKGGPKTVTGEVTGLRPGEQFIVCVNFDLWCADVYAPHLQSFMEGLMRRYARLPIAGAMHDEWGFPPVRKTMLARRAFWYSDPFAAAYAERSGGRTLAEDLPLLALPIAGREKERYAAIRAYIRTIHDGCVRTENDFYAANKRIWGDDVYVTKHATWWSDVCDGEILHGGLAWWSAKRDWAQADEAIDLSFVCGMTKLTSGPFWMNEGYGPDPDHYARTLWRYALAGGRMVYHGIYSGDGKTSVAHLPQPERSYHADVDLLTPDAVLAQSRVNLISLVTRAQIDCPLAVVFGHARITNWADAAYKDWGRETVHALGAEGIYADTYPSTVSSAFTVDQDGRLRVGQQVYAAVWLNHLDEADAEAWRSLLRGKRVVTPVYVTDSPEIEVAVSVGGDGVKETLSVALKDSVRQTPLASGLFSGSRNRLPDPDGVVTMIDGTHVRIKGFCPAVRGDALKGTMVVSGVEVAFEAEGVMAVHVDGSGRLDRLAAGGLRRISAGDFALALDKPVDVALVRLDDGWRGLWQTDDAGEPLPDALARLSGHWTRLILPSGCR